MTRRSLRRSLAALCTAVFTAGILGVAVGGSAGAGTRSQVPPPPPPPGNGVQIIVQQAQPIGPLSLT